MHLIDSICIFPAEIKKALSCGGLHSALMPKGSLGCLSFLIFLKLIKVILSDYLISNFEQRFPRMVVFFNFSKTY